MTDIPYSWSEVLAFSSAFVAAISWFVTLERRLMGKQDRCKHDEQMAAQKKIMDDWREADRIRSDDFFRNCLERIERNQNDSLNFKMEIRDALNGILIQIARLETQINERN